MTWWLVVGHVACGLVACGVAFGYWYHDFHLVPADDAAMLEDAVFAMLHVPLGPVGLIVALFAGDMGRNGLLLPWCCPHCRWRVTARPGRDCRRCGRLNAVRRRLEVASGE